MRSVRRLGAGDDAWAVVLRSLVYSSRHLPLIGWLRAQTPPCPWDERVCEMAAYHGQVEVLAWLRAQSPPCPWGERTAFAAQESESVLHWLSLQPDAPPRTGFHVGISLRLPSLQLLVAARQQLPSAQLSTEWESDLMEGLVACGDTKAITWLTGAWAAAQS